MDSPNNFNASGHPHNHMVPEPTETLSLFVSLTCISLMSLLFGRKTAGTRLATINYARGLVVALYIVSWLFSFMAAMLVQTNNDNQISCTISVFTCIVLYALSKIIIYLFLAERVHVVTVVGVRRMDCRMYKFNVGLVTPYLGILTLAIIYRVSVISPEGQCFIGLEKPAAIPLIAYDVAISSWLTFLFVRALNSSTSLLQGPTKSKLRDVARRTLVGSLCALFFSSANIASIVYFDGHQRGLACLALCTLDVTMNAVVIHWVTSRRGSSKASRAPVTLNHAPHHPQGFPMTPTEKHNNPLESHISVTVESYVEQYHQLHYGPQSSFDEYGSYNQHTQHNHHHHHHHQPK